MDIHDFPRLLDLGWKVLKFCASRGRPSPGDIARARRAPSPGSSAPGSTARSPAGAGVLGATVCGPLSCAEYPDL